MLHINGIWYTPGPQASQQMAELYLVDIYILKYIDYMVFMSLDVINDQSGKAIWEDNSFEVEL